MLSIVQVCIVLKYLTFFTVPFQKGCQMSASVHKHLQERQQAGCCQIGLSQDGNAAELSTSLVCRCAHSNLIIILYIYIFFFVFLQF